MADQSDKSSQSPPILEIQTSSESDEPASHSMKTELASPNYVSRNSSPDASQDQDEMDSVEEYVPDSPPLLENAIGSTAAVCSTPSAKRKHEEVDDHRVIKRRNIAKPSSIKTQATCQAFLRGTKKVAQNFGLSEQELTKWLNVDISQYVSTIRTTTTPGDSVINSDVDSWIIDKLNSNNPVMLLEVSDYVRSRVKMSHTPEDLYEKWASNFVSHYELNLKIHVSSDKEDTSTNVKSSNDQHGIVNSSNDDLDFETYFITNKDSPVNETVGLLLCTFVHGTKYTMTRPGLDISMAKKLNDMSFKSDFAPYLDENFVERDNCEVNKRIKKILTKDHNIIRFTTIRREALTHFKTVGTDYQEQYLAWAKKLVKQNDVLRKMLENHDNGRMNLKKELLLKNTLTKRYPYCSESVKKESLKHKPESLKKKEPVKAEKNGITRISRPQASKNKMCLQAFVIGISASSVKNEVPGTSLYGWSSNFNVMKYLKITSLQKKTDNDKYKAINKLLLHEKKQRNELSLTKLRQSAKEILKDGALSYNENDVLFKKWAKNFISTHDIVRECRLDKSIDSKSSSTTPKLVEKQHTTNETKSVETVDYQNTSKEKSKTPFKVGGLIKHKSVKGKTFGKRRKGKPKIVSTPSSGERHRLSKPYVLMGGRKFTQTTIESAISRCLKYGITHYCSSLHVGSSVPRQILDTDISQMEYKGTKTLSDKFQLHSFSYISDFSTRGDRLSLTDLNSEMLEYIGSPEKHEDWVDSLFEDYHIGEFIFESLKKTYKSGGPAQPIANSTKVVSAKLTSKGRKSGRPKGSRNKRFVASTPRQNVREKTANIPDLVTNVAASSIDADASNHIETLLTETLSVADSMDIDGPDSVIGSVDTLAPANIKNTVTSWDDDPSTINKCILSVMNEGIVSTASAFNIKMSDLSRCMNYNLENNLTVMEPVEDFPFSEVKTFIEDRQQKNLSVSVAIICQYVYDLFESIDQGLDVHYFRRWSKNFIDSYNVGEILYEKLNSIDADEYIIEPIVAQKADDNPPPQEPETSTLSIDVPPTSADNLSLSYSDNSRLSLALKKQVLFDISGAILGIAAKRNVELDEVYKWISEDVYKSIDLDKFESYASSEPLFHRLMMYINKLLQQDERVSILALCMHVCYLSKKLLQTQPNQQIDLQTLIVHTLDTIKDT